MAADTRARMVEAAIGALRCDGVAGMSFTDVLAASGAARGAIYHHFPGGKAQLVQEAAALNGQQIRGYLAALVGDSPADVVQAFVAAIRPAVAASADGSGCAVAAVTVGQEPDREALRQVAGTAFASWADALAVRLTEAGVAPGEATDFATTLITLLEGAHVLCRGAGSLEPFEQATRTITALTQCRYPSG
ncbi:MAG: TetR/AcrR family transcriptional regulator [Actinomycetota bacterium]